MALTLRSTKGSALNYTEMDNNWDMFVLKGSNVSYANNATTGSNIVAGVTMLFYSSSAPTGWTAVNNSDFAFRVVSAGTTGTGGTTAGTVNFSSVLTSKTPSGTVSSVSASFSNALITIPTLPAHRHSLGFTAVNLDTSTVQGFVSTGSIAMGWNATRAVANVGSSQSSHTHTAGTVNFSFYGNAIDFSVKYADILICTKA